MIIQRSRIFPEEDFPIWIHRGQQRNTPFYPTHAHERFNELLIALGGTGRQVINGVSYNCIPGDVFCLRAGDSHSFHDMRNWSSITIGYDSAMLARLCPFMVSNAQFHGLFLEMDAHPPGNFVGRFRLSLGALEDIRERGDSLAREYHGKLPGYRQIVWSDFVGLCMQLFRAFEPNVSAQVSSLETISDVLIYIDENSRSPVSLNDLAATAHTSVSTLTRAFKRATGMTPGAYITLRRISEACHLLRSSNAPITHIAFHVGFNDSSYFALQFKRHLGVTPRVYRRTHAHAPPAP